MDVTWALPGMVVIGLVFWGFVVVAVVAVAWWLIRRAQTRRRHAAPNGRDHAG
jgi:hypothetical protein